MMLPVLQSARNKRADQLRNARLVMTLLSSHLSFNGQDTQASSSKDAAANALPPPGSHLVLSDSLNAPADFALGHFVAATIVRQQPVVLVDVRVQGRLAWESFARKLRVNLPATTSKLWTHISPTSIPAIDEQWQPALFDPEPTLRPAYDNIVKAIDHRQDVVVVLDGLDELLNLGFTPAQVTRFTRAVLAECRNTGAILISHLHADCLDASAPATSSSAQYELLTSLCKLGGGTWWRVGRLDSGRSGEVMGEISCHLNFPPSNTASLYPVIPRNQPLQYRLTDGSVKMFPKGTGRGFL